MDTVGTPTFAARAAASRLRRAVVRPLPWLLVAGLAVAASAGCAKAKAASVVDGPPLEMPAPPPRVLAPVDEPAPAPPEVVEAPPAAPPATPARPPVRRPNADAQTRPEPTPPPAAAETAPQPAPAEGPRELRAAPSAADATAERNVRETLGRAARDLSRVDYGRLSSDGRAQYQQSKRFTQQAEEAVKDRNWVFASTLADKAATLAAQLSGR